MEAVRPEIGIFANAGLGSGGGDDDVEEKAEYGVRKMVRFQDPGQPTSEEVEEHMKSHVPYRSWCRHCVRGGGRDLPHKKSPDEATLPELHLDFFFMGEEEKPGVTVTILAMRERTTKMGLATVVPSKSTGTFAAERAVCFLREIGLGKGDIVIKSDQEAAIGAIVKDIERLRGEERAGRTIIEMSPIGSHASNGIVERYVQEVEEQVRILRDALET